MASIELPVLPGHSSLGEAISALEREGVSAVLVRAGARWAPLDDAALTRRGNRTEMPLAEIAAANPDAADVPWRSAAQAGDAAAAAAPEEIVVDALKGDTVGAARLRCRWCGRRGGRRNEGSAAIVTRARAATAPPSPRRIGFE